MVYVIVTESVPDRLEGNFMSSMTKFYISFLIIILFLWVSISPSPAQDDHINLNITILDYHGKINDMGNIKFIIDEMVSGDLGRKFFYPGKVVTLPIEGEKLRDIYLFDTAKVTLRRSGKTVYAGDLEITEKYDHKIELPLDLKTDLICDKKVYKRGEKIKLTIKARNDGKRPVILPLPTAQQYDFTVRNKDGEMVWQWSNGKFFINMLQSMIFALREEKVYTQNWNMKDNSGRTVPAGTYTIEGFISTNPVYPVGKGRVKITIK